MSSFYISYFLNKKFLIKIFTSNFVRIISMKNFLMPLLCILYSLNKKFKILGRNIEKFIITKNFLVKIMPPLYILYSLNKKFKILARNIE